MRRLAAIFVVASSFLVSGCTLAHVYFIRNLAEKDATVYVDFDGAGVNGIILPDSIYVPFSSTSHLINKNTYSLMQDSIVMRKWNLSGMRMVIPSGAMIMLDKTTIKKVSYVEPSNIEVVISGKDAYSVRVGETDGDGKRFMQKGVAPRLYWFDIY